MTAAFAHSRRGFTLFELLVVMGLIVAVGGFGMLQLGGRRSGVELSGTAQRAASLLRDAQGRAVVQQDASAWGVRFDNGLTAATPFFALYRGSYSAGTAEGRVVLPRAVSFATSTVPVGTAVDILFSRLTGAIATATTVQFVSGSASATVSVSTLGAVSF